MWLVKGFAILAALVFSEPSHSESLDDAWQTALAVDHSLRAARLTTASEEEHLDAAKSRRLPTLNVEGGYVFKSDPSIVDSSELNLPAVEQFQVDEKESLSYGANVSLPVYTGGRISQGINAANHKLEAAQSETVTAIQNLKMRVAEAYIAVLRTHRARMVAESQVRSLEAHVADTENLFEQGLTDKNALLSARVALADAKHQSLQARNDVDIAKATYNRILGRSLTQAAAPEEVELALPDDELEDLTRRALQQRPSISVLSHRMEALQAQAAAERSVRRPQAALSGGYNHTENEFQVHEGIWSVKLGLKWKLFDGGTAGHTSAAIVRKADALSESRADLASRIRLEVREAWLDMNESRERIDVTQQAVGQAEENLNVAINLFKAGMATHTEVLDAERLRTRTYMNHNNATYDAALAGLRLRRTLGEL